MLKELIKLNPYLRATAQECLLNPIFDKYRDTKKEKILTEMRKAKNHHKDKHLEY